MVRMSTRTSGISFRARRVAARPSMGCMVMSMTITSGWDSRAFFRASCPSAASATTSKPPWASRSSRSPSRKSLWSSARSIRILATLHLPGPQGQLHPDPGSLPGLGMNLQASPDKVRPFLHPLEADGPFQDRRFQTLQVKAPPIILHLGYKATIGKTEPKVGVPGLGVLGNIVGRLLENAKEGRLHGGRQTALLPLQLKMHPYPGTDQAVLGVRTEGRDKPQVVQGRGPQV